MTKEQTIYMVTDVIYIFGKLCGMAPYASKSKERGYSNTFGLNINAFISFSIIGIISSVLVWAFIQMIMYKAQENFFNQINTVLYVLHGMRIMSAIITMLAFFFTQENFITACEKLNNIDEKKKLYSTLKYNVHRNSTVFVIFIIFSIVAGVELMNYYVLEENITAVTLHLLSNGLQLLIHLMALLYFQIYLTELIFNFKFLRSIAENVNNQFKSSAEDHKKMYYVIKTISTMYNDLCEGAGLINHVFSFPLFSLITLSFMELLLGIYLITDPKTRNISSLFWTSFYGIQLFSVLIPPGIVEAQDLPIFGGRNVIDTHFAQYLQINGIALLYTLESTEISKYLAEAEMQPEEELLNKRNHLLLRTLHQTVQFTACGFFPISTSAVIGQFSMSVSFLLFMFQIIK